MCLVSNTNTPYKTSCSIECYKVLEVTKYGLLSPFHGFLFEIGKTYTSNEDVTVFDKYSDNKYFVENGFFHSCKNMKSVNRIISILHTMRRRYKMTPATYKIFKAEIPINTEIFEGQDEDIASKSLKIIEECVDQS